MELNHNQRNKEQVFQRISDFSSKLKLKLLHFY